MSYSVHVGPQEQLPPSFEGDVTYNVSAMLKRAGIHPNVLHNLPVVHVRPVIWNAYMVMRENPEYFRQFDAPNGWGTYETTFAFVERLTAYLDGAPHDYVMRWN